jgi:hypothetical protein
MIEGGFTLAHARSYTQKETFLGPGSPSGALVVQRYSGFRFDLPPQSQFLACNGRSPTQEGGEFHSRHHKSPQAVLRI